MFKKELSSSTTILIYSGTSLYVGDTETGYTILTGKVVAENIEPNPLNKSIVWITQHERK